MAIRDLEIKNLCLVKKWTLFFSVKSIHHNWQDSQRCLHVHFFHFDISFWDRKGKMLNIYSFTKKSKLNFLKVLVKSRKFFLRAYRDCCKDMEIIEIISIQISPNGSSEFIEKNCFWIIKIFIWSCIFFNCDETNIFLIKFLHKSGVPAVVYKFTKFHCWIINLTSHFGP